MKMPGPLNAAESPNASRRHGRRTQFRGAARSPHKIDLSWTIAPRERGDSEELPLPATGSPCGQSAWPNELERLTQPGLQILLFGAAWTAMPHRR